jgi:3-hydroxybutyryl-CoA dehydrogenase
MTDTAISTAAVQVEALPTRLVGPRFEPPALLREVVAAGRPGRTSGEGFYPW